MCLPVVVSSGEVQCFTDGGSAREEVDWALDRNRWLWTDNGAMHRMHRAMPAAGNTDAIEEVTTEIRRLVRGWSWILDKVMKCQGGSVG